MKQTKSMKKLYFGLLFLILLISAFLFNIEEKHVIYAQTSPVKEINYVVYDEYDNFVFERTDVSLGDKIIDKQFNEFEVYLVDESAHIAKVRFLRKLKKPFVTKKTLNPISSTETKKKIALYMTHNDESYLNGDGFSSIYGAGGIHDIAKLLANEFEKKGIEVSVDETLHIPHDSYAYNRSCITAKRLLKENPNAIFDIHRDGVKRSNYVKWYEDVEHCQVRIVVGQANPNKETNLQFALYLMSVAETVCPWLFTDVYFASGHYNQGLYSKALLFEMGTHTIEKDLVKLTVPYLAEVIDTTLFETIVDEESGDLKIGNTLPSDNTVDVVLDSLEENQLPTIILIVLFSGITLTFVTIYVIQLRKKSKVKKDILNA